MEVDIEEAFHWVQGEVCRKNGKKNKKKKRVSMLLFVPHGMKRGN